MSHLEPIHWNSQTYTNLLRARADMQPDRCGYTFLAANGDATAITYAELDRKARAIGAALRETTAAGERVLLLYPPGLDYVAAFFGCLYGGMIAVPAYPPNPARLARTFPRLRAIATDARPAVIMTTSPFKPLAETVGQAAPEFQSVQWLATDELPSALSDTWQPAAATGDSLAFLQYTSGSTAAPKGVMVSHGNLLHNSALIQHAFGHTPESKGVIWLPPYHDMGLIGGILQPLYAGFPVVLMSPIDFLQQPLRWLRAISTYQATTSGGPNFAYDLCVRKITEEQRAALDLRSWRVAFNGAEPIRTETLDRFAATFASCGFRRQAWYPCYGLAEATLIVSGAEAGVGPITEMVGRNDREAADARQNAAGENDGFGRTRVSSGRSFAEQTVTVVDPATVAACPDGQIGEIWVAGQSVALGYWGRPDQTEQDFNAHLATGEGPFLRTGDLGFLRNGELFVTGRLKDLVIIRGRNYYPQDIEASVERCHPAVRAGACAAFVIEAGGEERLVIAQELEREHRHTPAQPVVAAIRRVVAAEHELSVHAVALLKPGSIPKTSSGKIQRYACREGYLAGTLAISQQSILDESAAAIADLTRAELLAAPPAAQHERLTAYLTACVARALGLAPNQIGADEALGALGLDSLSVVELQSSLEKQLGVVLAPSSFLRDASSASLAAELLAQLRASATLPAPIAIAPTKPAGFEPLSYGQRALWFLQQMAPDRADNTIASALRIRAALDIDALRSASQQLVDRHPALRTNFVALEGEPWQRVHTQRPAAFWVEDATPWTEAMLNDRLTAEVHRPFDLAQDPLLRVRLFTRGSHDHVLLITLHHIIADYWSLAVMLNELGLLYSAAANNVPASLPPLSATYTEYVRWQTELLSGPASERLWSYWRTQLVGSDGTGAIPVLELPTSRPRPPVLSQRGAALNFALDATLASSVKGLAKSEGMTPYTILLTAFLILLNRYTGQQDIVVGTPTAGRSRAAFHPVVGYFVNPVVMRTAIAGNPTAQALLRQVRDAVLDALDHQEYPLALLVERLHPQRDLGRAPLFQVMFVLEQSHLSGEQRIPLFTLSNAGGRYRLGGLELEGVALNQQTAQFELTLIMEEQESGLAGVLQYSTDLFDAELIAGMAGHFKTILAALVSDPGRRINDIPIVVGDEWQRLITEWNATETAIDLDRCLHEMIAEQACIAPERDAVVLDDERICYRELDQRANQLAHRLQALGVGPEVRVALCLEQSIDVIIGVVAILKAGGAYVPLDPTYPPERLAFMLEDACPAVLITHRALIDQLPARPTQTLVLDDAWPSIRQQRVTAPVSGARPDSLAYIIYTSGSTGRPKGVECSHRGVVNFLEDFMLRQPIKPGDGCSLWTNMNFDVSVYEIFSALTAGGTIHIVPERIRSIGDAYVEWLRTNQIASCYVPPFMISALTDDIARNASEWRLRRLLVGVEPISESALAACVAAIPGLMVINGYGPTEVTIGTVVYEVPQSTTNELQAPIGRPIVNTQVYVLDQAGRPVPEGVPGELYLGSVQLARGYHRRPDMTADRFVPNPFSAVPGARMYRTGDRVRWLPDGNLHFLGRLDHQIKLRGYRIELGEIEALLAKHTAVRECTVIVREAGTPQAHLAAYVVANGDSAPTSGALRAFLKAHLPEYMVPSVFVLLEALPLNPNGKLDRRALPAPSEERVREITAPTTPTERVLATIWAELLPNTRLGVHDNFFELGGHSLLATQAIARVRALLGVELPLSTAFQWPTIAELAAAIDQIKPAASEVQEPVIAPVSRESWRTRRSALAQPIARGRIEIEADGKPERTP